MAAVAIATTAKFVFVWFFPQWVPPPLHCGQEFWSIFCLLKVRSLVLLADMDGVRTSHITTLMRVGPPDNHTFLESLDYWLSKKHNFK